MTERNLKEASDLDLDEDYDEDSQVDKYLTFHLGNEEYGIDIRHVTEIVGMQKITEVPDMPNFVKGVINLRGNVIPIVDVRMRFQMQERLFDDRTCVIVVEIRETNIGLIVDMVHEVSSIPEEQISPPPQVMKSSKSKYIKGIGKAADAVIILLEVDKLLFDEEFAAIEDISRSES